MRWLLHPASCGAAVLGSVAVACGAFGVDEDGSDSGTSVNPTSPDAAGTAAQFDATADSAPNVDAESDALGSPHCSLAWSTRIDFTHAFDPKTIGWFRSDALSTDFAGLVAVSNSAPSLAHCELAEGGVSLNDGFRVVYHVQFTQYPDIVAPVRILTFGDDSADVRLTIGSGANARVAQLDESGWGYQFADDVPTDAVYVASFRRADDGTTTFCGAVKSPAEDLSDVCTAAQLAALPTDDDFVLPQSLQYLELGLPANAQNAATVSIELRIDALP